MNKTRRIISLAILAATLLCVVFSAASCSQYNTVSTGTKYKYALIGDVTKDGATLSERLWAGIKAAANSDEYYRYYPLAEYHGSDGTSVETARAEAIKKQIFLANSNSAATIVIPAAYTDVFDKVFDGYTDSTYKNSYFLIVAYPCSNISAKALKLDKMAVLTIESGELGYMFGYTAVMAGMNPGYVGISGAESTALYSGMVQGADVAAAEKASGTAEYPCAYVNSADEVSAAAATVYGGCDIILSDMTCEAEILKAAATAGKYVMSMTGLTDATVKFAFAANDNYAKVLGTNVISKIGADGAKEYSIGVGDEVYNFVHDGSDVFNTSFDENIDDVVGKFRKDKITVTLPEAETDAPETDAQTEDTTQN